jgi:hypothetical protein
MLHCLPFQKTTSRPFMGGKASLHTDVMLRPLTPSQYAQVVGMA